MSGQLATQATGNGTCQIPVDRQLYAALEDEALNRNMTVDQLVEKLLHSEMDYKTPKMCHVKTSHDDVQLVIVSDLAISAATYSQLFDLTQAGRFKDLADVIRAGIRMVLEQNVEALLSRQRRRGLALISDAIEKAR